MAEEYSKYKLFRKYKTEDGVNYTPLDEYQALYESGDGVDCSCGYREYEWVDNGNTICGSKKELLIDHNTDYFYLNENNERELATTYEIIIPKGYYNEAVIFFYNYVATYAGGGYGTGTTTIIENGTFLTDDKFYATNQLVPNDKNDLPITYTLNYFRLYKNNVENDVIYDKPITLSIYNGRTYSELQKKEFCPNDSLYDKLLDETKVGDVKDISFDCGFYRYDLEKTNELVDPIDLYPTIEITRVEGDFFNYYFDSNTHQYSFINKYIDLNSKVKGRIYFKLNKPCKIKIGVTASGHLDLYDYTLYELDKDMPDNYKGENLLLEYTILDTNEHFIDVMYERHYMTGMEYSYAKCFIYPISFTNYDDLLYKYDINRIDVNDKTRKEKTGNYIYLNGDLVKFNDLTLDDTFTNVYYDGEYINYLISKSDNIKTNTKYSLNGYWKDEYIGTNYQNNVQVSIDAHYGDLKSLNGFYINKISSHPVSKKEGVNYDEPIFFDNIKCLIEKKTYDYIEYIPSDDDEILDGIDIAYYITSAHPFHTYRKVQGYKILNGENVGKHIGDFKYIIYEENKYYYDYTITVTSNGECSFYGINFKPNYNIRGEFTNQAQCVYSADSSKDATSTVGIFSRNGYGYKLYSLCGFISCDVGITSIRLPSLSNCIDVRSAFYGMRYLEILDATYAKINIDKIGEYYSNMFNGCSSLTSLILGDVTQEEYDWWYQRLADAYIQNNVTITYNIV